MATPLVQHLLVCRIYLNFASYLVMILQPMYITHIRRKRNLSVELRPMGLW